MGPANSNRLEMRVNILPKVRDFVSTSDVSSRQYGLCGEIKDLIKSYPISLKILQVLPHIKRIDYITLQDAGQEIRASYKPNMPESLENL